MKRILIFGAGKSATDLINYIGKNSSANEWEFIVADAQIEIANKKIKPYPAGKAVAIDVTQSEQRAPLIQEADIIISLLPPSLHIQIAKDCIKYKKNLLTASYIDPILKELESSIEEAGILFLCEMGLDPGIDHMSAMELIHRLKQQGAEIQSFISHCGGLIAPENDNNPWHYKISWNPRNIVLAGAAGAVYKLDGSVVEKKYPEIFENCKSLIIPDFSNYVWYPNRDSMSYIPLYQLEKADTFIRTTIRHKEFCEGWDILIGLGLTNPTDRDELSGIQNFHDWIAIKLKKVSTATSLSSYLENYPRNIVEQIEYLELDRKELLPRSLMSSADILQWIIERKLALGEGDRDMIIMQHEISYSLNQQNKTIRSTLVVKGENQERTAMSKTVGLPLGIAAKLILEGKIRITGLKIPIESAIYEPVLEELKLSGIAFHETII